MESQFREALEAYHDHQMNLAKTVIEKDKVVDQIEIDIEELCLQILALYQPVAADLRYVISVLKINDDLERIGDIAVNIAETALRLNGKLVHPPNIDLYAMSLKATHMLKDAIDSFITSDAELARKICSSDAEIDNMHFRNYELVQAIIEKNKENVGAYMQIMSLSRYIERMADLATNIAEDVVYIADGSIIRRDRQV